MIFLPLAQGSSSSASGTRVVLPAPGGATSTAVLRSTSARPSSSSTASIGRGVSKLRSKVSGTRHHPRKAGDPVNSYLSITKIERTGYPASAGYDNNTSHLRFGPAADALVDEAVRFHFGRAIDIAQIDHDRVRHLRLQAIEVKCAKLSPLRDKHQRIGTAGAEIGVVVILDIRQLLLRLFHADRIVRPYLCAHVEQAGHQRDRRRLAHVVGIRLEGQPEDGDGLAAQVAGGAGHLARHRALAVVVDAEHSLHDTKLYIIVLRGLDQRAGILREA